MNPYEIQRYVSVYNNNPNYFDDDFLDELEKKSKEFDIPFQRNIDAEEQKQDNLLNQFVSGVSEGFTTLGWADDAKSESGQILNSIGHLIGFAPALLGTIFSGGALGAARGALAVGKATRAGKALLTAEKLLLSGAKTTKGIKSFPFLAGDAFNKHVVYKGLAKAGVSVDKYVKAGSKTASVLTSAQSLGAASAVSGMWGGKDEVMNSYMHGALAGGVFGAIGNFMNIGKLTNHSNPKVRSGAEEWIWQKVAQGVAGGAFQGGMATMQGAPTSVQIYEYALGGFFGYSHPNAKIQAARKHIGEFYGEEGEFTGREREMTSVEEFSLLPEASQTYVRDHFNRDIGERFEKYNPQLDLFPDLNKDDPSYAAVFAKAKFTEEVVKPMSLEKRRKELINEGNSDLLSKENETLARIRAMDDIDTFTSNMREGEIVAEVTDKVRNKDLTVSNEADIVYDKLSKEQKDAILKGDTDTIYNVVRGPADKTVGTKEARDIENMDRPIDDQLEVDVPYQIKELVREIEQSIGVKETGVEVLSNIVDVYNKAKKETLTFESFIDDIQTLHPEYAVSPKVQQGLRSVFNRMQVEVVQPYIHYDRLGSKVDYRTTHDPSGKRTTDNRPPASDEQYFKDQDGVSGQKIFNPNIKVNEIKSTKYGDSIVELYGTRYDQVAKDFVPVMEAKDWWNLTVNLEGEGKYAKMPNKDKGTERVYPYHPEATIENPDIKGNRIVNPDKWNEVQKKLKAIDPDAIKHIREDFNLWMNSNAGSWVKASKETREKSWDIYRKTVVSNFLYEPHAQFKNAPDRVKRETLQASKGIPLREADFLDIAPDGTLGFVVVNDVPSGVHKTNTVGVPHPKFYTTTDGKTRDKGQPYESMIDGWITVPEKLFTRIVKSEGLSKNTARIKPTVWAWVDGKLFAIKGGIHPSHAEYDKATGQANIGIAATSSTKVFPDNTDVYWGEAGYDKKGQAEYRFKDKKGKRVDTKNLKPVKINIKDLRIDYGVREDEHSYSSQTVKKQFHVLLNELQVSKEGYESLMNEVFAPGIKGTKGANHVVKSLFEDPNFIVPEDFHVKNIGDAEFVSIINNPYHPLFKRMLTHMTRETKSNEYLDSFGEEGSLVDIADYTTRLQRIAKYSDFDPITTMWEPELYQAMILRYRKIKYMYPKWESSASSWGAGVDPVTVLKSGAIKPDTFKLGHSMRKNFKVKWGKSDTQQNLGELWEAYNDAIKSKNTKAINALGDMLDIAIMRVPSPAVSGTRMLKFDGFVENSSGKEDYGTYMHPKDHFYADGMDVDGDKVFMYQGLPKSFRDQIRKNKDELSMTIDGKEATYANKAKELDPLFGTGETPAFIKSKVSQYLPAALRKSGQSSYKGKKGMGAVVNAKTMLNYVTSDIIKNNNGRVVLDLVKNGKKYGSVTLETSNKKLDSSTGYRRLSVEASSRTADSSNYWEMMTPIQMREVLLKSAFDKIVAMDNKGKIINFNYKDIVDTTYGNLYEVNNKLFGFNYETNRQWNIKEVQSAMEDAQSTEPGMNSLLWLSNKMSANQIDLRYAKGNKEWRKLVNTWNNTWKGDKSAKDFLVRKKLMVTPSYLETDRIELQKRIDKEISKHKDLNDIDIEGLKAMGLSKNSKLDKRWQKVFDSAWADKVVAPMDALKESKLILNDALDIYSSIVVSKKGEKLYNAIVKTGRTEKEAQDFLGLLAEEAVLTKTNWRNARQGNRNKFLPAKYALDDVERSMKKVRRSINDKVKEMGIDKELALDYYHTYMTSTLYPQPFSSQKSKKIVTDWLAKEEGKDNPNMEMLEYYKSSLDNWSKFYNKTSLNRFPFETKEVPERIKKEFIQGFTKMWNVVRRDKPLGETLRKDAEAFLPEEIEVGDAISRSQKETESKIVLERFFDKIFEGKKIEDIPADKIPEDIPRVMKMLVEDLKSMPPEYATRIEEMYAGYGLERTGIAPRVSEATWRDLRQFQQYLRTTRVATAKEPRVKKAYYLMFPERLGEKQLSYDMTQVYKYDVPYNYAKEKVGFLNIRVPFSTFKYLNESFNQIYQFENAYKESEQEEIQRQYDWRDQILGLDNGTTEFAQLHRAAISRKLATSETLGSGDVKSKAKRKEYYNKLWEENEPVYNELKNKKYKITEEGQTRNKTGEEVMDWIVEKHDKSFKRIYKKWVTSGIDWSLVDDKNNRDYAGINDHLVRFNKYGRMDVDRIQRMVLESAAYGKKRQFEALVNQTSLSVDLLNRVQYEIIIEKQVANKKLKPDSLEAQRYRESLRALKSPNGEYQASAYKSIGKVKEYYWPQMMHMATRKSRRDVREYINQEIARLRREATRYADDISDPNNTINIDDYNIKKKWLTNKSMKATTELFKAGKLKKSEFIERFIAKQELDFENFLGGRVSEDGGASKAATDWLLTNQSDARVFDNIGFNERPGTGKARAENPMPGFSLDFEVVESYSGQWVSSFHKNLTAVITHKAIERFKSKNKLLKEGDMKDWENFMKMYARDVMGYSSVFSSDLIGFNKEQLKRYTDRVTDYEKRPDKFRTPEETKEYAELKEMLRKDGRLKKVKKTIYYKLSDENVAKKLEWVALKLGGKDNPKLPFMDALPKSEQARKLALMGVAKKIGAFEAKWSLISLLSHPKTAVANMLGGSTNTISQNGLRHFTNTKDKAFLYNIFKGGKLRDGTVITPDNVNVWLGRFAEESGALESFIVSEAQLERGFRGTKVKGFLKEYINEIKKDYSMPDQSLYDLAKKHGINKAIVDGGAWFMRKSERMLRKDSFLAHYLNNHELLSEVIPNLKFDNPYLLRMATEGVKATQFLYHSSAKPAFSRTATGKMLTRFMPFAWNSIRFRKLAYQKAAVYDFDMNTLPGKRFQRVVTLDAFVFALANIFVSSIFDSALPPPMSYMQDTADWLFGDEKQRERAYFNQWPHPALAPLSVVTGPSLRFFLGPTKAIINNDWEPFLNYQLWTWAPFGRMARSINRTIDVPEMWLEESTGIPIHSLSQKIRRARKKKEAQAELDKELDDAY